MHVDAIDMNEKAVTLHVNLKINNKNCTERENPDINASYMFLCLLSFRISYGKRKQTGCCVEMEGGSARWAVF